MIFRTYLPDDIRLPDGTVLKPVIGGHLDGKPFLTQVDLTRNGWGDGRSMHDINQLAVEEAKRRRLKYRRVAVLSRRHRQTRDLHGSPYRPTGWVFVEVRP